MRYVACVIMLLFPAMLAAQNTENSGQTINWLALLTPEQTAEMGLNKLNPVELQKLNAWFAQLIVRAYTTGLNKGKGQPQPDTPDHPQANPGTTPPAGQNTATAYSWNSFYLLEGSWIIASDGQPLGKITTSYFDSDSLMNSFGKYGNEFNHKSIFNEFGPYGNEFSHISPFNAFSSSPPIIMRDGKILAYFSANKAIASRVDPRELIAWLKSKQ